MIPGGGGAAGPRSTASSVIEAGTEIALAGGRRFRLDEAAWRILAERLGNDPLDPACLWSDGEAVHALFPRGGDDAVIASVLPEANRYLGLSARCPAMSPHERMIRDLWGFEAMAALDLRPLLDHGDWSCTFPLADRPGPASWPPEPPEFPLTAREEASGATQLGLGPVGGPVAGPAHLRLVLAGDRIRRVDPLFGFAHRGAVRAVRGGTIEAALFRAGRLDASVAVAAQCAVADAAERVAGLVVPERARALRLVCAGSEAGIRSLWSLARLARELERPAIVAEFVDARSGLSAQLEAAFGNRLMFDVVVPGGMRPPARDGALPPLEPLFARAAATLDARRAELLDACDRGAVRTGDGRGDMVRAMAEIRFDAAARAFGSAAAALRGAATTGPVVAAHGDPERWNGEGLGAAASVRGTVRSWLRLGGGRVAAFHLHDPGVSGLVALQAAAVGMRADRFGALCAATDVSAAGIDQ